MVITENAKLSAFNVFFNGDAIREIILIDGIVNIKYESRSGRIRKVSFKKIQQVDYFLSQVIYGYEAGKFDDIILDRFVSKVQSTVKTQIINNGDIESFTQDLATARKFIDLSIEAIFQIYLAQDSKCNLESFDNNKPNSLKKTSKNNNSKLNNNVKLTALKLKINSIEFSSVQSSYSSMITYSDHKKRYLFRSEAKELIFNELRLKNFTHEEQLMIAYFAGLGGI